MSYCKLNWSRCFYCLNLKCHCWHLQRFWVVLIQWIQNFELLQVSSNHEGGLFISERQGDIKIDLAINVIKTGTAEDLLKILASFKHHLAEHWHGWVRKKYKSDPSGGISNSVFPHICRLLKTSILKTADLDSSYCPSPYPGHCMYHGKEERQKNLAQFL